MYILIAAMVLIYILGYFVGFIQMTPGVLALIAMVFLAVGVAFAVVKKQVKNQEMSKKDLLAVVVISILCVTMMILLRDHLPEAFGRSIEVIKIEAQSFLNIP